MARYQHLPIYKRALELNIYIDGVVRNFSRYHKYGIGQSLRTNALQVLQLVIRANSGSDRSETLIDLRVMIEETKALFHLAKEIKAFPNFNSFAHGSQVLVDLARQNEGWLKHQQTRHQQARKEGP